MVRARYCHMQKGIRNFRVQRIENLRVLDRHFTRPSDFRLGKRLGREGRDTNVRALFSPEIVSWVRESPSFFSISQEDTADGLLVTFSVREEKDVLQYILGWGRHVRVLEPQSSCRSNGRRGRSNSPTSQETRIATDIRLSHAPAIIELMHVGMLGDTHQAPSADSSS